MVNIKSPHKFGPWLSATAVALIFFIAQLLTLDYGTLVNDRPHIANYNINHDIARDSGLDRPTVVGEAKTADHETVDRWMARFKLYSVEADEMVSIMALARIKPKEGMLDPGFYQYGGAWLYPLGAWYYSLAKIGLLPIANLETMISEPNRMDAVYFWGRTYDLVLVTLSSLVLFAALRFVSTPAISLLGMAIFLSLPATVMFSQVLKPHWPALLWIHSAFLLLTQSYRNRSLGYLGGICLGFFLGMAVGSSIPNALFAIFTWLSLLVAAIRGFTSFHILFFVPTTAILVMAVTNPFLFLNWHAVTMEGATTSAWYVFEPSIEALGAFLWNSIGFGFGFPLLIAGIFGVFFALIMGGTNRNISLAILFSCLLISALTAAQNHWHTNYRYAVYLAPAILFVLAMAHFRLKTVVFSGILLITLIQATPLKLAYIDENDIEHSTRLLAAKWIDENIPEGDSLCLGSNTPAPFEVPPFQFSRLKVNSLECNWRVSVDREFPSQASSAAWEVAARFQPRLFNTNFPVVFGHINPQITIYHRAFVTGTR